MRRMSFGLTRDQFLDGSKKVTRRKGWKGLRPGDRLLAVSQCMGLKPGESAEVYGPIEVVSARRQKLSDITAWDIPSRDPRFNAECTHEGFPEMTGSQFVDYFCRYMGGPVDQEITRIVFRRVEPRALDGVKLSPSQRALVDCLHTERPHRVDEYYSHVVNALHRRGLTSETPEGGLLLTDFGRQVAAELRAEELFGAG